nr:immunoglobulin heavy chain junction region [Mus musculus]MBK4189417.1 immunoglobulin heavy chain junction region [Mus musculus]
CARSGRDYGLDYW